MSSRGSWCTRCTVAPTHPRTPVPSTFLAPCFLTQSLQSNPRPPSFPSLCDRLRLMARPTGSTSSSGAATLWRFQTRATSGRGATRRRSSTSLTWGVLWLHSTQGTASCSGTGTPKINTKLGARTWACASVHDSVQDEEPHGAALVNGHVTHQALEDS